MNQDQIDRAAAESFSTMRGIFFVGPIVGLASWALVFVVVACAA